MSRCLTCGTDNAEGDSSCSECAQPLTDRDLLPAEERKVVTVLFCDLVGFTAVSELADPEDVRARLRPYHAKVRREIERYGGSVEKFIGDAVMAVWGAPLAHEDDSERAVRAALRILDAIEELNLGDPWLALAVRIGIATGEALVVLSARPDQGETFVTGDVVNTAARLQGSAPVGTIVVGEPTFRATERIFDYEPLPAAILKGKAEPTPRWRVRSARSRFGSDLARGPSTPLVGRERERAILRSTFDRAVRDSTVQLVTVAGEPGIGKSRLVEELFQDLDDRPSLTTWRQGRCLPYGDRISFWALGEIIKAEVGVLESDSREAAAAKLDAAVPAGDPDREWLKARLGTLVGLSSEPAAQEENFAAWRRFLEGVARSHPTVLVFEDLHWADDSLLAFLEYLTESATSVPVLLLCTARPDLYERHPGWAGGQRNATIDLAHLSEADIASLIAAVLGEAVIPAATEQLVTERSGGNPLYAKEFVRLLRDRDLLDAPLADLPFPESLQSLISARLDTLPGGRKGILQDGAVVGKVFWAGAVAAIGDRDPAAVIETLHDIARQEFVQLARSSSLVGEVEYGFGHILVRDVCYAQIPRGARAAKHIAAAAWLEASIAGRAEDLADVLAYHFSQALELSRIASRGDSHAELQSKAVHYLVMAGDRELALDVARAETSYAKALALAPPGDTDRPRVQERWANAAQQAGRLVEAADALAEAIAEYRLRGERLPAGRALTARSIVLSRLGDPVSDQVIGEAVALLESEPPGSELIEAYAELAASNAGAGAMDEAIANADRALGLAAKLGLDESPRALGFRGLFRCIAGDAEGLVDMRRALQLAHATGMGRETAVLHANLAYATGMIEGPASALQASSQALEFAERTGRADLALQIASNRVNELYDVGEWDEALATARQLAAAAKKSGVVDQRLARFVEASILALRGDGAQAIAHAEWLEREGRDARDVQWIAPGFAGAALALLAGGQPERALGLIAELNDLPSSRGDVQQYLSLLPELVRTAIACGDVSLAGELPDGVNALYPIQQNALLAANAAVTEGNGEVETAASLYASVADRWRAIGNIPELGFALVGQGRCLNRADRGRAELILDQAREIFVRLGARPSLEEVDRLMPR